MVSKIAVSIDSETLTRLDRLVSEKKYANRSRAIQEAIEEKLKRIEDDRLLRELAKLDPQEEKGLAEAGLSADAEQWPEY